MKVFLFFVLCLIAVASAEVFFQEDFGAGWENRWVVSKNKEAEGTAGVFEVATGKYFKDAEDDKGLRTTQDARFYQITAGFPEFSNKGKTLVLQYTVKSDQSIDCGGSYLKVLPSGIDQENFSGDTNYNIMFGPDVCGNTKRTHLIFNYKGKNLLKSKDLKTEHDIYSHVYTLILNPDNTYAVLIDNNQISNGTLVGNWDFLAPKEIRDPAQSKPADWVDLKTIADPEAKKPEGWDDIPKSIPDPDATKPEDWDDELDGEWEVPQVANPEYKGEWKAPTIPNPAYQGEWVHPMIPNPEYFEDPELYLYPSNAFVGIEIWQVKAGTIFDNILLTDDIEVAYQQAEVTNQRREAEKAAKTAEDEARKAENANKADELAEDDEEDDDEDFPELDLEGAEDEHEDL